VGLTPWYTSQTAPTWQITCAQVSDTGIQTAVDLTGSTVKVRIAPAPVPPANPVFVDGAGTLTVPMPVSGIVNYMVSTSDFPTPGTYLIQVKATNGGAVSEFDYLPLQVLSGA